MFQHEVLPLLDQRGCAVPVERVLHDHDVVIGEELLLAGDVDVEIRVVLVQVVEGHAGKRAHGLHQPVVDPRLLQRRVGEQDEDLTAHAPELITRFREAILASAAVPAVRVRGPAGAS